jgi:hypothetical protein
VEQKRRISNEQYDDMRLRYGTKSPVLSSLIIAKDEEGTIIGCVGLEQAIVGPPCPLPLPSPSALSLFLSLCPLPSPHIPQFSHIPSPKCSCQNGLVRQSMLPLSPDLRAPLAHQSRISHDKQPLLSRACILD